MGTKGSYYVVLAISDHELCAPVLSQEPCLLSFIRESIVKLVVDGTISPSINGSIGMVIGVLETSSSKSTVNSFLSRSSGELFSIPSSFMIMENDNSAHDGESGLSMIGVPDMLMARLKSATSEER